jgi:secretion/DNA translocation related TadE-like protein
VPATSEPALARPGVARRLEVARMGAVDSDAVTLEPAGTDPRDLLVLDSGFATVWALAWIIVSLTVGWAALLCAAAVAAQHHLDGSTELASLSAAASLQHGGDPCRAAALVAADNAVVIAGCRIDGADVVVSAVTTLSLPLGMHPRLTSTARAGPDIP